MDTLQAERYQNILRWYHVFHSGYSRVSAGYSENFFAGAAGLFYLL